MREEELAAWLGEDHADTDVTARSVVPEGAEGRAQILAKEPLVLSGLEAAVDVLEACDATVEASVEEGERVAAQDVILEATGPAYGLLSSERTALNVLGHLSGIATQTRRIVDAVEEVNGSCRVLATRKTTPGLRSLEHAAVQAGGGQPHRRDLSEQVLIKENHLAFVTVEEAVQAARSNAPGTFCMVEAETVEQARAVARAGADGVLLDNFDPDGLDDVVELLKRTEPGLVVEASGGITVDTVQAFARHVDRVSLGSITHSAPAADVSMRIEPA